MIIKLKLLLMKIYTVFIIKVITPSSRQVYFMFIIMQGFHQFYNWVRLKWISAIRRRKFLGLLCPRRPYIELFCVERKVKIIINNTWNIPFFTFIEQKLSTNFS